MTNLIFSIEILVPLVGHWVVGIPHISAVLPVDHSAWKCDKCCIVQTLFCPTWVLLDPSWLIGRMLVF